MWVDCSELCILVCVHLWVCILSVYGGGAARGEGRWDRAVKKDLIWILEVQFCNILSGNLG